MKTIHATIQSTKRLTNTKSGNPVWELLTADGSFKTEPDAQVGHFISGLSPFVLGPLRVRLTLNEGGRVIGVEEDSKP